MDVSKINPENNAGLLQEVGAQAQTHAAKKFMNNLDASEVSSASVDAIDLSSLEGLKDIVKSSPDVRTELVEEMKQAIADGSFDPSGNDIADALLEGDFGDLLN